MSLIIFNVEDKNFLIFYSWSIQTFNKRKLMTDHIHYTKTLVLKLYLKLYSIFYKCKINIENIVCIRIMLISNYFKVFM